MTIWEKANVSIPERELSGFSTMQLSNVENVMKQSRSIVKRSKVLYSNNN